MRSLVGWGWLVATCRVKIRRHLHPTVQGPPREAGAPPLSGEVERPVRKSLEQVDRCKPNRPRQVQRCWHPRWETVRLATWLLALTEIYDQSPGGDPSRTQRAHGNGSRTHRWQARVSQTQEQRSPSPDRDTQGQGPKGGKSPAHTHTQITTLHVASHTIRAAARPSRRNTGTGISVCALTAAARRAGMGGLERRKPTTGPPQPWPRASDSGIALTEKRARLAAPLKNQGPQRPTRPILV